METSASFEARSAPSSYSTAALFHLFAGDGNLDIWVHQTTGGPAIRLTSDPVNDDQPEVSPDGGDARLIAPHGMAPRFSPDGRSIAFWTGRRLAPRSIGNVRRTYVIPTGGSGGLGARYVIEASGGAPRKVCDDCQIHQWTRDNRQVVIVEQDRKVVSLVDIATGARAPVITAASEMNRPLIAPNARWIMFSNARRVLLAPLHAGRVSPGERVDDRRLDKWR